PSVCLSRGGPETRRTKLREFQSRLSGAEDDGMQMTDTSAIVNEILEMYQQEGLAVPYTMQDFRREIARKYVDELTAEERLAGLPAEKVLTQFSPEQRLAGLPPDRIEAYLERLRKKRAASRKKKPKHGRG